jgi:hypothetical protein
MKINMFKPLKWLWDSKLIDKFTTPTWESQKKMSLNHFSFYKDLHNLLEGGKWWLPHSHGCDGSYDFELVYVLSTHEFDYKLH